jgi:hypothetical protein
MTISRPFYSKDNSKFRIVCKSNGLWQVQYRIAEHGYPNGEKGRIQDNWEARSRWMPKEEALARLASITKTQLYLQQEDI